MSRRLATKRLSRDSLSRNRDKLLVLLRCCQGLEGLEMSGGVIGIISKAASLLVSAEISQEIVGTTF